MERNKAGKWVVFAYGAPGHPTLAGLPIPGDAINITADMRIDGGSANPIDDVNPTELGNGYYVFDYTAIEANGDLLLLSPVSVTSGVVVIGTPGTERPDPINFANTMMYGGPRGLGIYISSNAEDGGIVGQAGTEMKPVNNVSTAISLALATGIKRFYLLDAYILITDSYTDWEFVGCGDFHKNTIDLNQEIVTGSSFYNITIEDAGVGAIYAENCRLKTSASGGLSLKIVGHNCGIVDTLYLQDDSKLINSYSLAPNGTVPVVRTGGASKISITGHKGSIAIHDFGESAELELSLSGGEVVFDASNHVNATINLSGIGSKTDNTAGLTNLTEDAFINMNKEVEISATQMNAIADHVIKRNAASARASNDGDAVEFRSLLGAVSKLTNKVHIVEGNLVTREEDDETLFGDQILTTDPNAEPVVGIDTV